MNKVTVLVEGYAKTSGCSGYKISSSAVLVESNNKVILCDPGMDFNLLVKGLKKVGKVIDDIVYVFLTHKHVDHSYNMARFPMARVIEHKLIYDNQVLTEHNGKMPSEDIQFVLTPGHSRDHCSIIIPTEKGVYAVAGDVFWWIDDEDQKTDRRSLLQKEDYVAENKRELRKSRKKLLKMADFIIPGHGKMFKV
jgi:glyoxylase-like metal-dependent hydrolase (beta-lactamase superfamily II)